MINQFGGLSGLLGSSGNALNACNSGVNLQYQQGMNASMQNYGMGCIDPRMLQNALAVSQSSSAGNQYYQGCVSSGCPAVGRIYYRGSRYASRAMGPRK